MNITLSSLGPLLLVVFALGCFSVLIWAFIHEDSDNQEDLDRKQIIKDIEKELDDLKKF